MSTEIIFKNFDRPLIANLEQLKQLLDGISAVVGVHHRLSEAFIRLFRENFQDIPLTPALSTSLNKSN
jgi:hypothetical protein